MSEHLENAIYHLERAGRKRVVREPADTSAEQAIAELHQAVNHLVGAVQVIERRLTDAARRAIGEE